MRLLCLAFTAQLLATVTAASGQQGPTFPPAFGANGGTANASTSNVKEINEALGSVVAVESGRSTAPLPVQEAFLASMKNDSTKIEGAQTVRPTYCFQLVLSHFPFMFGLQNFPRIVAHHPGNSAVDSVLPQQADPGAVRSDLAAFPGP